MPGLAPDTAALVEELERVRERPGTVELFDALIAEDPDAVARALGGAPRHPRAAAVLAWLGARGVAGPRPDTVEEVLARNGILDLEEHLQKIQGQLSVLQRGLDEAWARASRAETVANAYAAVLVLFVGLAVMGWAAALDVIPLFSAPPAAERPPREPAAAPPAPAPE